MKNNHTLVGILFLCIKLGCIAQTNNLAFRQLTTENGLSFNYTWCMLKDDKGFMWFGTRYGLNRFDGTHIKTYYGNPADSLSLYGSEVFSLQADHFGTIWILSDGGLCYLNTNQGNIVHRIDSSKGLVSQAGGNKIYIDRFQHLWLFTGEAFCEYNITDTGKIKLLRLVNTLYDNDAYVNFFAEDSKGNMYCSTDAGFYKINKAATTVIEIKVPAVMNGYTPSSDVLIHQSKIVRCGLFENDTTLWLGMYNLTGLVSYNIKTGQFNSYKYKKIIGTRVNMVCKIFRDKNPGNLWIGTYDDGLYLFNIKTKKFIAHYNQNDKLPQSLNSNDIRDVLVDDKNILWVATGAGVSYENPQQLALHDVKVPFATGVADNDVLADIFPDSKYKTNHTLWISSTNDGLIRFDDSSFHYKRILPYTALSGMCIDASNGNYLWLAKHDGLKHVDTKSFYISDVDIKLDSLEKLSGLYRIYSYPDKIVVVLGYGYAIYMRSGNLKSIKHVFKTDTSNHSYNPTLAAIRDKQGRIYIYTNVGKAILNRVDPADNTIHEILGQAQNNYHLPNLPLVNVYPVSANNLLLIYQNGVYELNFLSKTTKKIKLPINSSEESWKTSCADSAGNIWLLSPEILAVINQEGKLIYYQQVNILNISFSAFFDMTYDNNGIIYIGQIGHYFYFNPGELKLIKPLSSEVKITSFNILEKDEPLIYINKKLKNYTLSYKQNVLRFEFAALNYAAPASNHYAYKLEGFNKGWIDCETRTSATFTNLDGGHYTFEVKAANGNNGFGNSIAALAFYVSPPFYNTWWFITITILAIFGLAYFFLYLRQRQALQVLGIRNRIARDLHDDVGSALSSISIFSDVINKNLRTNDEQTSSLAARIGDNARQVIESMSDIIWAIKPSNESVAEMLIRMKYLCSNLFESKEIAFDFETGDTISTLKLPMDYRHDIYLIFKEAVNNIVKYAACKNVSIKFTTANSLLTLLIKDDGVGFNTEIITTGNGLQNIKARAAAMQGKIIISSNINTGTIITLIVPIP